MAPLHRLLCVLFAPLVLGYAAADAMPEGSRQLLLTEALAKATLSTPYTPCPPTENMKGVQVACYNYAGSDPLGYMQRLDETLFTFAAFPDTFPGLEHTSLTPYTDYWVYLPEYSRFERSFDFGGGTYRIIYVPFEELSSTIAVLFTPAGRQVHLSGQPPI